MDRTSALSVNEKQTNRKQDAPTNPATTINNKSTGTKSTPPQAKDISPITTRDNSKWNSLSNQLKLRKISYSRAKLKKKKGIEVIPTREDDYRKMNKTLKELDIQFSTFQLRSEGPLKVVLSGIPTEITPEEVIKDLHLKSYPISKSVRMRGK